MRALKRKSFGMNDTPKLSRAYLEAHELVSGKQVTDCEHFGRSVLALAFSRAIATLGDDEVDELIVDLNLN